MTTVAVATVNDLGAADMLRDVLTSRGIDVEVKELPPDRYLAILTPTTFELRVPAEREAEARGLIAEIEAQAEEEALREYQDAEASPEGDAENDNGEVKRGTDS